MTYSVSIMLETDMQVTICRPLSRPTSTFHSAVVGWYIWTRQRQWWRFQSGWMYLFLKAIAHHCPPMIPLKWEGLDSNPVKQICGLSSIVLVSLQGQFEIVTYFGHSCQLWYPFLLGGSGDYHSRLMWTLCRLMM
jgi:hypothetical protein